MRASGEPNSEPNAREIRTPSNLIFLSYPMKMQLKLRRLHFRSLRRQSPGATFLLWTLALAFYYDWYCYPFKMGSTATSPSYNDTPSWISAIKYFIFFVLCAYLLSRVVTNERRIKIRRPLYVAAYMILLSVPILYGTIGEMCRLLELEPFISEPQIPLERIFEVGIFFVAAILLHALPARKIDFEPIVSLMKLTLVVYLVSDLFEIMAFLFLGRLPAEAYENSVFVRFGSLMDKPNYFGILTSMFFGLIFACNWRYLSKLFMSTLLSIALFLTFSYTAWAAVGFASGIYALVTLRRLTYRLVFTGLLAIVAAAITIGFALNTDLLSTYQEMVEAKSGSVSAHAQSLETMRRYFNIANLIGLEPHYEGVAAETQYVEIATTEGVVYLLLFVLVMGTGLYRSARILRRPDANPHTRVVASAAFCLLLATVVAGFALPVLAMFPLNLLAALMLGICSSGILECAALPSSVVPAAF